MPSVVGICMVIGALTKSHPNLYDFESKCDVTNLESKSCRSSTTLNMKCSVRWYCMSL